MMAQSDFQTLLAVAQAKTSAQSAPNNGASDRNGIIKAMADGNMSDLDIARQMGMTRDEVRMVLNLDQKGRLTMEGTK